MASEKKARTFDFMAMFEQAKKTAMERSEPVLKNREEELISVQPEVRFQSPFHSMVN